MYSTYYEWFLVSTSRCQVFVVICWNRQQRILVVAVKFLWTGCIKPLFVSNVNIAYLCWCPLSTASGRRPAVRCWAVCPRCRVWLIVGPPILINLAPAPRLLAPQCPVPHQLPHPRSSRGPVDVDIVDIVSSWIFRWWSEAECGVAAVFSTGPKLKVRGGYNNCIITLPRCLWCRPVSVAKATPIVWLTAVRDNLHLRSGHRPLALGSAN